MPKHRQNGHQIHAQLGRNLRARREALGLSQTELAEALGCNRVNISNIERGAQGPTVVLLVALCLELECKPTKLLEGC